MRGESSEAIVGVGVGVRAEGVGKGSASPPLSAAVSQVSLTPSDLTTSDPDLATSSASSSAASSRPPSSSQVLLPTTSADSTPVSSRPPSSSGLITPELALPAPEDYTTETVEFPTSPQALKCENKRLAGVCFLESEEILTVSPNNLLSPNYKPDETESSENSPKQGNGFEVGSDIEEDYFEEFHLPNSHENAFVRHKSFRRKVHLTPINAPDAERIEGLVRTGEFQRHGSIRRRIVSDDTTPIPEDTPEGFDFSTGNKSEKKINGTEAESPEIVGTFDKDLREIENMLDDSECIGDVSEIVAEEPLNHHNNTDDAIKQTSSTPKSESTKSMPESEMDESCTSESLSIEQSTLMKVRECMDFTKYKDIYNLSGRLQDILSPKEIEEVLNNSEKYSEYVNQEVIEALHNSLQEHQHNTSGGQTDSGISSPKKRLSAEGLDLDVFVNADIRAVIDESTPDEDNDHNSSKRSSYIYMDDDDEDEDENGFRLERRRSFRVSKKGDKELEVEGVFVESKSDDIGLKKIKAPTLDLSGNTSEENIDISDLTNTVIKEPDEEKESELKLESESPTIETPPQNQLENQSPHSVPDIVITEIPEEDKAEDIEDNTETTFSLIDSDVSGITNCTDEPSQNIIDMTPQCPPEERPKDLDFDNFCHRKRISVAEDILRSPVDDDSISVASAFSQRSDCEDDIDEDILEECAEIEALEKSVPSNIKYGEPNEEPLPQPPPQMIPVLTALEESTEERHWRTVVIGGVWHSIDMKVIAPYRKCISHGGYLGENRNAVIVVCACQLPDRSRRDYDYVMDNLFLYVLTTLEQLIAEDYVLVYLAGGTPKTSMPTFHWLKRAYQMIDRKLRKNLKALHVVHPTFWVKAVVAFSRPFISTKFYRKLSFVKNLTELAQMVPLDQLDIPDAVKQADFELMIREKKKNVGKRRAYSTAVER